jgi:antitoxin VapB
VALSIKNANTERLARELAATTGESITDAVEIALVERLDRVRARSVDAAARAEIDAIIRRVGKLRIKDARSAEEIVGYDDSGAPT